LVAASSREVVLQTALDLPQAAEVCVGLAGGCFFAKVRGEHPRGVRLRLTAHDRQSTECLDAARHPAGG